MLVNSTGCSPCVSVLLSMQHQCGWLRFSLKPFEKCCRSLAHRWRRHFRLLSSYTVRLTSNLGLSPLSYNQFLMATITPTARTGTWRQLWLMARHQMQQADRPAWRRFWAALFGLGMAFFLALYSTALSESGAVTSSVVAATVSLLLAAAVAIKVVPYLAQRSALERWMIKVEYQFTREGAAYFLIIILIAGAALNTGNNLLFIVLANLLAGILLSGILSAIVLAQIALDFALPEHVFAERPIISRLTVENEKWFFPWFSLTVSARDPEKGKRKPAVLTTTPRQILDAPVYVPYIPHRSGVTQHVELTFPRRGRYTQDGFRVSSKFPFGLLLKAHEVESKQEILVLPNVQPTEEFYEMLPLIGGEIESYLKGRGHDLYAIRDYTEADSARHVDWKATAKAQQLKVREFTREDERRLVLVFDASIHSDDEQARAQFEKGVNFCACLAWHFYEIDAQMQFIAEGFATLMAPAGEIIYPVLESLALAEPKVSAKSSMEDLQSRIATAAPGFHIVITNRTRGSIPTNLWGNSYLVFTDSL